MSKLTIFCDSQREDATARFLRKGIAPRGVIVMRVPVTLVLV